MESFHDEERDTDHDHRVGAISLLVENPSIGVHVEDHMEFNDGAYDPADEDETMTASLGLAENGVRIVLTVRLDDMDEHAWLPFRKIPFVVTFMAIPPVAWFLVDMAGHHLRAPVVMGERWRVGGGIDATLARTGGALSIEMLGVDRRHVRSRHFGIGLKRVAEMMRDAIATLEDHPPSSNDIVDIIASVQGIPCDWMFEEAMGRHLTPRREPSTCRRTPYHH